MNALFAAGLFDNPWIVAVIIIVSALASWLSKRREKKQADQLPEDEETSAPPGTTRTEFNLEDALRRLMGEEPPAPVPPPIPRASRDESQPEPDWEEEEPFQPVRQTVPPLLPPIIAVTQTSVTMTAVGEQLKEAARRFEQSSVQRSQPATVVRHGRGYRSHTGNRIVSQWRDPRRARQAFVASLVFGTPKGLES